MRLKGHRVYYKIYELRRKKSMLLKKKSKVLLMFSGQILRCMQKMGKCTSHQETNMVRGEFSDFVTTEISFFLFGEGVNT